MHHRRMGGRFFSLLSPLQKGNWEAACIGYKRKSTMGAIVGKGAESRSGSGASAKNGESLEQVRPFNLSENDKNFRTLVYRKRRLSDSTLMQILLDPFVSRAFKRFLQGEFGEQLLQFYFDAQNYACLPASTSVKDRQEAAARIFNKYIAEDTETGFDIGLDHATRQHVSETLTAKLVGSSSNQEGGVVYKVTTTDQEKLKKAFYFSSMKAFQLIKFEYLPLFISSQAFQEMQGLEGFFADEADQVKKAQQLLSEMDMKFILEHPVGIFYLQKYFDETNALDGNGTILAELYEEVQTFERCGDPVTRRKRLDTVVLRYSGKFPEIVPSLEKVKVELADNSSLKWNKPSATSLQPIKEEITTELQKIEAEFKQSEIFQTMSKQITTSAISSLEKVSNFHTKTANTQMTIKKINEFAEARNLKSIDEDEEISFQKVLNNSQGLVFFRRYAIENFMEDSIMFYVEVEKFKQKVESIGAENDFDLMQREGQRICTRFLVNDASMQINVSAQLREDTIQEFRDPGTCSINSFQAAEAEVLALLKNNLWAKFKSTPRFEYLRGRIREREMIREIQGRVGQEELDRRRESLFPTL